MKLPILLIAFLGAVGAQAGAQDFDLTNKTDFTIYQLYLSPKDQGAWGKDILNESAFSPGQMREISFASEQDICFWDIKIQARAGAPIIWKNLNLCEISNLELHYDRKKNEATAIYRGLPTVQDFQLTNNTDFSIYELNLSPKGQNAWGREILRGQRFSPGQTREVKFNEPGDSCFWDLRVRASAGRPIIWEDLDLCSIVLVELSYNRKTDQATAEFRYTEDRQPPPAADKPKEKTIIEDIEDIIDIFKN